MTRAQRRALLGVVFPAIAGVAMATLAGSDHSASLLGPAGLALVAAFVIWPWSVLPLSIVGGAAAASVVQETSVSAIVALHGALLAAGLAGVCIRSFVAPLRRRRKTRADLPMLILAALVALGSLYGVAVGNRPHAALVAAYELGVIPAYYWIATITLADDRARLHAMNLFLAGALALAAVGLATPGRHGGLLSAIALVPTMVAAGRATRARVRWSLLAAAALLGVDVALAAYRSVWLATVIALIIVAARGARSTRRILLTALTLAAGLTAASLAFSSAVASRLAIVGGQLHASAGYRLPEAVVGLHAFEASPLLGSGLGQTTPSVYIPNFRLEDVGPIYHVFYVTVLANGGVILALALAAALLPSLLLLLIRKPGSSLPWAAVLAGFVVAAAFAAPTDGHWELGLLAALAAIEAAPYRRRRRPAAQKALATAAHAAAPREPSEPAKSRRVPAPSLPAAVRAATNRQPGVHAVVVTYDSCDEIAACLDALVPNVDRVVVVDNASSDGTAVLVAARFPAVELIANETNRGFARAVNQGTASAVHDTVMLANPDCTVERSVPQRLRAHLAANEDVGVVGPRILSGDGSVAVSVHPFETLASVIASRFGGSVVPLGVRRLLARGARREAYRACTACDAPCEVDWASGACLAIRTELLERLGGLDEGYFMYYEDEELCLRARQAGARVVYLPSATVRHAGGASSADPAAVWPVLYASMLRFFARHRPISVPPLRMVLIARAMLGTLLAAVRGRRRQALAWWRIARLAGRFTAGVEGPHR